MSLLNSALFFMILRLFRCRFINKYLRSRRLCVYGGTAFICRVLARDSLPLANINLLLVVILLSFRVCWCVAIHNKRVSADRFCIVLWSAIRILKIAWRDR